LLLEKHAYIGGGSVGKEALFARSRFTVFAGNGSGLEVEGCAESVGIAGGESDDVEHCR